MQVLEKILQEIKEEKGDTEDYVTIEDKKLVRHWNNCIDTVAEIIRSHMEDNGWIPAQYPPKDDKPILLSFEFYDFTSKGRYIMDDKGGAYFMDGADGSCISQGIIVNAWYPLPPEPYQPKEGKNP